MDGQGNVREGTHFLFSTTPEGHLVTEGGWVLYLVVALPGGGAFEMAHGMGSWHGYRAAQMALLLQTCSMLHALIMPSHGRSPALSCSHHAGAAQGAQHQPHLRQLQPPGHWWVLRTYGMAWHCMAVAGSVEHQA